MAGKYEYDAILMDIQMPVMNGFEATQQIRKFKSHVRNIPIIAMTAHAMAGDQEKSLAAGLNDHVTKPIDSETLFKALLKWIEPGKRDIPDPLRKTANDTGKKVKSKLPQSFAGIDIKNGLSRVNGNEELYINLLVKFSKMCHGTRNQIADALEKNDMELGTRLAHTLKSVAGNLGARELQDAATDVETAIKKANLENIVPLLQAFEDNIIRVMNGLNDFVTAVEAPEKGKQLQKEIGTVGILINLLQELEPHLQKSMPKPSKEVMAKVGEYEWGEEYRSQIDDLNGMINRYMFKEAYQAMKEFHLTSMLSE